MTRAVQDVADEAEAENIHRFGQRRELLQTVDDALRCAEALPRLHRALRDGFRYAPTAAPVAARLAGWAR